MNLSVFSMFNLQDRIHKTVKAETAPTELSTYTRVSLLERNGYSHMLKSTGMGLTYTKR